MGATNFSTVSMGKDAAEAFAKARAWAQHMEGHGGYTGTIAEKHGFRLFTLNVAPRNLFEVERYVEALELADAFERQGDAKTAKRELARCPAKFRNDATFRAMARCFSDKWGDAVAIEITGKAAREYKARRASEGTSVRGQRVFLFFGLASC
jgi:hypothetical protein